MLQKSIGGVLVAAAAAFAAFAVGLTLGPQALQADDTIHVPTHAQVGGATQVTIDIKPCSYPNVISLPCRGSGVTPVAILTTADFDASTVDPSTMVFAQAHSTHSSLQNVDHDGDLDLILYFKCQQVSIPADGTEACLQGRTYQGLSVEGCDSVRIIVPRCGRGCGAGADAGIAQLADTEAVFASTPIGTPSPGAAGMGAAPPVLADAIFASAPTDATAGGAPAASSGSSPPSLWPARGDGDLATETRPWLLLLVGASAALTLAAGCISFVRQRRR